MASGSSTDETGPPHRIPDSPRRAIMASSQPTIVKLSDHPDIAAPQPIIPAIKSDTDPWAYPMGLSRRCR
ncbi:hypothetical protein CN080_31570 [Sinorhizobium meliloti]|nr:hypothetical protein CN080_31570 [Sinorhizobium meliloti]